MNKSITDTFLKRVLTVCYQGIGHNVGLISTILGETLFMWDNVNVNQENPQIIRKLIVIISTLAIYISFGFENLLHDFNLLYIRWIKNNLKSSYICILISDKRTHSIQINYRNKLI